MSVTEEMVPYSKVVELIKANQKIVQERDSYKGALLKAADLLVNNPKGSYRGENAGSIAGEAYAHIMRALGEWK